MDEGIAMAQRSNYAWIDVEFTEGEEQGIPDGKANNPITERLVTVMLSYLVAKLLLQGKLVKGEKISQILLDDYLNTHDIMAAVAANE